MRGLKLVETLQVEFKNLGEGEDIILRTAYFYSIAQALDNSKAVILNRIAQWVSEGSVWTVRSVEGGIISILCSIRCGWIVQQRTTQRNEKEL